MDLTSRSRIANCSLVFMIFFIYLGAVNFATVQAAEEVCTTAACNKTAEGILEYMRKDVDPCDNFYELVCGEFDNDPMIIIFGYDDSVFGHLGQYVTSMIQYYFETASDEKKNEPFQQAFDLFAVCSDQDTIKAQGIDPLKEIIDEIGGWPLVDGSEWQVISWENVTRVLTELGYDSSIFFDVHITQIIGPTIQMSPAKIKKFSAFTWNKLMVVATKLGADPDTLPPVDSKDHLHNLDNRPSDHDSSGYLTIDQMITRWPSIDWMTYFKGVFAAVPDVTIKGDQGVVLTPEYVDAVVELLKKTPSAVIMNYVAAKVVEYSLDYLSPDVPSDPEKGIVTKQQPQTQRNARCAYIATREMPLMIEAIFQVNYVDDHLQNTIMNLSAELQNQLGELISKANWLDNFSQDSCMNKLHDMEFQLGFPEDIKNGYYTDDYVGIEIDKNSYLHSILNINRFKTTQKYVKSIENDNINAANTRMKITSINAQYNNDLNEMDIMPGILQDPFYNSDVPMYITYGGIGFVIGHELTHGFDFEEKIFPENPTSHDEQEDAKDKFRVKRNCVNKQFEDYVMETWQLQIDGYKFSRENIADDGGSKVAFNAYKQWVKKNGVEAVLPGLNYDTMQMYWIALAHTICGKYNPSMVSSLLDTDTHGLHEFRVNAPFSNNPDFAKTFNCPLGSPMNPEEKCIIW